MNSNSFHPIIYVRGYAMTENEIEDTVADPYMGFNIGSCKMRQMWDGSVKKYFFESPLVRLLKQFDYRDVYDEGLDRVDGGPEASGPAKTLPYKSIVIYRYYEPSSDDLGKGLKPDMRRFADGLGQLILDLRKRLYPEGSSTTITDEDRRAGKLEYAKFRVYLIAHSMGGLVVRSFLQNAAFASDESKNHVDKVFTYATPHNGIELSLLGNVPRWLSVYGMNTFNRDVAAEFLGLTDAERDEGSVDIVTRFDAARIFNLVGTNPGDYRVAAGLSSAAVGPASDGLVRIANATTRARSATGFTASPNAFVHRSHSGYFGIVNSEEGYQNLIRFLFGDVRADGRLEVDELTLPPAVQAEKNSGKEVRASYLFEVTVSIRGKSWQLHRRLATENSAIMRTFDDLFPSKDPTTKTWQPNRSMSPPLFSVFLDQDQSQTKSAGEKLTLAFAADICVRSTGYEVDGALFFKNHYEGGYLFRDMVTLEGTPPAQNETWTIRYRFENEREPGWQDADVTDDGNILTFEIPIKQLTAPGIRGRLRIETRFWNHWQ
jgi:PGAP1-like protein